MVNPGPVDPICPACSEAVIPGDLVIFGHGELLHVKCHFTTGGADVVAQFLSRHSEVAYCHTCLATTLDVAWADITKAITQLRLRSDYRVGPGVCSICSKPRVAITRVC